jgi:hypothetical protein
MLIPHSASAWHRTVPSHSAPKGGHAYNTRGAATGKRSTVFMRRFGAWFALCLAALVLGLLVWKRERHVVHPLQAPPRNASLNDTRDSARLPSQAVRVPLPSPDSAGQIQVCGIGAVRIGLDADALNAYASELIEGADARWRASLLSSDDYRARAVGLYLQGLRYSADNAAAFSDGARRDLVNLAVATHDPAVYAIALHTCRKFPDAAPSGSCQQISAHEWSRIEPLNAVPWLLQAAEARGRGDAAGEATAFEHAAAASASVSYGNSLYSFARASLPDDLTPLQGLLLAERMKGYEAALAEPQDLYLTQYCSSEAVQDQTVRNECGAIAELLVRTGTTLLDLGVGRAIGSRVGWSSSRLAALKDESDALIQEMTLRERMSWECDSIKSTYDLISEGARIGERAAAMESLERSGSTLQERAAQWRDAQR